LVVLSKIYTRGGDTGKTSLGDGSRVAKHHLRVECYGTVDEANATIGIARLHVSDAATDAMLAHIQNELFDLGADLCRPLDSNESALRVSENQIERLETEIDRMNENLEPLNSFVLPGGSPLAAHLHLARTTVRRAERLATALSEQETINEPVIRYLNRLSDHLFVLSRKANDDGRRDVLWVPGATRGDNAAGHENGEN
jgi:cob(I)alamin adenosyltransferase